jgi:hypothetical protein
VSRKKRQKKSARSAPRKLRAGQPLQPPTTKPDPHPQRTHKRKRGESPGRDGIHHGGGCTKYLIPKYQLEQPRAPSPESCACALRPASCALCAVRCAAAAPRPAAVQPCSRAAAAGGLSPIPWGARWTPPRSQVPPNATKHQKRKEHIQLGWVWVWVVRRVLGHFLESATRSRRSRFSLSPVVFRWPARAWLLR